MYSNSNNDLFSNWGQYSQENRQSVLQDKKIKDEKKTKCELAFDSLVKEIDYRNQNQIEDWVIDASYRAPILRFYKEYRIWQTLVLGFLVAMFTFVLSFYTKYAVFGILITFIIEIVLSDKTLFFQLTRNHILSDNDKAFLKEGLFLNPLNYRMLFFLSIFMIVLSYFASFYSYNFFINFESIDRLIKVLSKWSHFIVNNELFAFLNVGCILILLSYKIIERWR